MAHTSSGPDNRTLCAMLAYIHFQTLGATELDRQLHVGGRRRTMRWATSGMPCGQSTTRTQGGDADRNVGPCRSTTRSASRHAAHCCA